MARAKKPKTPKTPAVASSRTRVLRSRPVRDVFWMTIGILVTAYALDAFLIPNKIASGGVSGLATVIFYLLRDTLHSPVVIPVGMQMLVMNIVLLAIGIRARGWRYGAKTIYGAVGLSLAIDGMALFVQPLATHDPLLAVLWGGALSGLGMGLVFRAGGNTGGTDIVAQLLARRVSLGTGQIMLAVDALVILAAGAILGPTLALYGAVAVLVMGAVIDIVLEGLVTEKALFVISEQSAAIADAIMHDLGRGATALQGRGLYTGQDRDVLFVVVSRRELDEIKSLINTLDPHAFVVISDVHEALGEGFREHRTR